MPFTFWSILLVVVGQTIFRRIDDLLACLGVLHFISMHSLLFISIHCLGVLHHISIHEY